jgi:hypothetical protein
MGEFYGAQHRASRRYSQPGARGWPSVHLRLDAPQRPVCGRHIPQGALGLFLSYVPLTAGRLRPVAVLHIRREPRHISWRCAYRGPGTKPLVCCDAAVTRYSSTASKRGHPGYGRDCLVTILWRPPHTALGTARRRAASPHHRSAQSPVRTSGLPPSRSRRRSRPRARSCRPPPADPRA